MQWFFGPGSSIPINDNIVGLAPTPLFHFEVEDADDVHARLIDFIDNEMPDDEVEITQGAVAGEPGPIARKFGFSGDEAAAWQDQTADVPINFFLDKDNPDVQELRRSILKSADFVRQTFLGGLKVETRLLSSWVQTYASDDFLNAHNHKGPNFHPIWQHDVSGLTLWSGAYYIDDGDPQPHRDYSGVISFIVHGQFFHIKPKPGLMLMWPSEMFHFVNPFIGSRRRVMLSWNLGFFAPNP